MCAFIRMMAVIPACLALAAMPALRAAAEGVDDAVISVTVQAEIGRDVGQTLGTLFEAKTLDGRFTIGAGFCDVWNTRFRNDRGVVQFFVRPTSGEREFTTERLPRPRDEYGAYMYDFRGELIAGFDHATRKISAWDEITGSWQRRETVAPARMRLGDGVLAFGNNRVWYNGELILDAPERGSRGIFYYANGYLCFYHIFRGETEGYQPWESDEKGFSKVVACPWSPQDGGPVDLSRAVVMTLPYVGETTFAWGQFDGSVLTVSNVGGIYRFDGSTWHTLREPELGASYQVYTMIPFYDRLMLGQYPSGELWAFDGESVTRMEGWPPRLEGTAGYSREAQSALIWGGDLLVGVWPWAELWRYSPDSGRWYSMGRMFTGPEVHADPGHPWEAECRERDLVLNQWGQRLTSLVPFRDTLMASTSAKWPISPDERPDFIPEDILEQYGSVLSIRMPGCLSAPIHWTLAPTEFEFIVTADRMIIRQNGLELAAAALDDNMAQALAESGGLGEVTWGEGVFGPWGGKSIAGKAQ